MDNLVKDNQIKIKQPPVLFDKTQELIGTIESIVGGPLITYWNNPRGEICHNDVIAFYELIEKIGKQSKLFLFIKSRGGHGQASLRIMNMLRQYTNEIIALVPIECASAATMLVLGANEIHMGPMAFLSAVDTSLEHDLSPIDRDNDRVSVSLDELKRVLKLWKQEASERDKNPFESLYNYIHPLVIGAVDRADSLSIMICKELLSYHIDDPEKVEAIAQTLNSKYPSHSYPIMINEAKKVGLNVKPLTKELNTLLLELNELYSEMGQKATTDFDEIRAHSNEIINILEAKGLQIYYQQDKDWFYRMEERRWITMNDNSGWRKIEKDKGQIKKSVFYIS